MIVYAPPSARQVCVDQFAQMAHVPRPLDGFRAGQRFPIDIELRAHASHTLVTKPPEPREVLHG